MTIKGIDFIAYSVKDLDGCVSFYRDKLGLDLSYEIEGMYAEFDVGGQAFGLYCGEEPEHKFGGVGFHVDNIAEAVADLKAKGVENLGDIEETPVCRMAFYEDPEGNSFILHETPKV